ncbi:MAG TPA: hypothetical protein PKW12_07945, partial [Verrucomicrobiota bacterium]|nr:hypothetical protein [Verrucomicrobiota bacterium]
WPARPANGWWIKPAPAPPAALTETRQNCPVLGQTARPRRRRFRNPVCGIGEWMPLAQSWRRPAASTPANNQAGRDRAHPPGRQPGVGPRRTSPGAEVSLLSPALPHGTKLATKSLAASLPGMRMTGQTYEL